MSFFRATMFNERRRADVRQVVNRQAKLKENLTPRVGEFTIRDISSKGVLGWSSPAD